MQKDALPRWLAWLPSLFHAIWTFFPGLVFVLLAIGCFWELSQGGDILLAYLEEKTNLASSQLGRPVYNAAFYFSVVLWVYVTWYSSRIIADMKEKQTPGTIKIEFLYFAPRVLGHACFLVIELALFQLPALAHPLAHWVALILLVVLLIGLTLLEYTIRPKEEDEIPERNRFLRPFWIFLLLFLVLMIISWLCIRSFHVIQVLSIATLVMLHGLFMMYINYRRVAIRKTVDKNIVKARGSLTAWIMKFFGISSWEKGYLRNFLWILLAGFLTYLACVIWLAASRWLSPIPVVLLGFCLLLAFVNLVAALSVKYGVNIHFIFILFAFIWARPEKHAVRLQKRTHPQAINEHPCLAQYLGKWLDKHVPQDTTRMYDAYFIMSNGGASRSGYWTAAVLSTLEDSSIKYDRHNRFSDHIFCLSGASGGEVGLTTFFSMLRDTDSRKAFFPAADTFMRQDFLTYTLARMLGPDYFRYILPIDFLYGRLSGGDTIFDRGRALEQGFEGSARKMDTAYRRVPMDDHFSNFPPLDEQGNYKLPLLFINTTRMSDGNPGVVSNLYVDTPSTYFNRRIDVVRHLMKKGDDISLAQGAILGARFPFISPGGAIYDSYFVDGGYFDNSGAGVVQELIQGIRAIAADSPRIARKLRQVRFVAIHIVNSPLAEDKPHAIQSINNDLFSPLVTVLGTYEMQTTVNDNRLYTYLRELNVQKQKINTDTILVSLYKPDDTATYPMNWFMSDSLRHRMRNRLQTDSGMRKILRKIIDDARTDHQ